MKTLFALAAIAAALLGSAPCCADDVRLTCDPDPTGDRVTIVATPQDWAVIHELTDGHLYRRTSQFQMDASTLQSWHGVNVRKPNLSMVGKISSDGLSFRYTEELYDAMRGGQLVNTYGVSCHPMADSAPKTVYASSPDQDMKIANLQRQVDVLTGQLIEARKQAASLAAVSPPVAQTPTPPVTTTTVSTQDPPETASLANEVKKLSADDLIIQTHRWDGKLIETEFQCLYADKDDFRCVTTEANQNVVRVDFSELRPSDRKSQAENCDTQRLATSPACRFTIRYIYDGFDEISDDDGGKTHIVKSKDNLGEIIR